MIDFELFTKIKNYHEQEGLKAHQIARQLDLDPRTVARWLAEKRFRQRTPAQRESKLDPFKDAIIRMLEAHPYSAAQVLQRIREEGFGGGYSIVKDYVRKVRPRRSPAFLKLAFAPGECAQVDWGAFGSIQVGETRRRLSFFVMVLCYSRMMYVEFTVSQTMEHFLACHQHAFASFGGTVPRKIMVDNLKSAVIQRIIGQAPVFNPTYLDFANHYGFSIAPCGVRKGNEKGKVEKGAIHYIRHNFWPLRVFQDLDDVQAQANGWRDSVANVRLHSTTGERPGERFKPESMTPLPELLADCRDSAVAKVHSDFSIHFDGNTYSAPPWLVGKTVTARADHHTLTIYFKDKAVATHKRSWHRKQRIESAHHREAAQKSRHHNWLSEDVALLMSLGEEAKVYVEKLAATQHPLKDQT